MAGHQFTKERAVLSLPVSGSEDHSAKRGFLAKLSSGASALNDSATVPAFGVILDGEKAGGVDSIGVLGGSLGNFKFKAGGTIHIGNRLMQKNDGSVIADDGASARVVVGEALEEAVADELFEGIGIFPIKVPALIATVDGSDAASTQALANAIKANLNALNAAE